MYFFVLYLTASSSVQSKKEQAKIKKKNGLKKIEKKLVSKSFSV